MKTPEHKNNNQKKIFHTRREERGVALLFTVLLTSMLLLVALGIANISYKELLFSNEARDSDRAFFAADTGIECALYLDKIGAFPTGTTPPPPEPGNCRGITYHVGVSNVTGPASAETYTFKIPISTNNTCVDVTVSKAHVVTGVTGTFTKISAVGYNVIPASGATTCTSGITNLKLVSRALRTQYQNP